MLEVFAILLMALAAFLHYRAGIWGAMLTVFAALVAGAAAFGFYLPVSALIGSAGFGDMHFWGDALMFLVIFLAAFAVLRLVAEQLLKNDMGFPPLANTIGGAAIGLVAGYLVAGIFTVFVQMLPLPPTVLGYEPFKLGSTQRADHLVLQYDEFVVGLYGGLSRNALQYTDPKGEVHELAARFPAQDVAAAPDPSRGSTADDMLYHYFLRRVEFALRNTESPLVYGASTDHKVAGVPLVNAKTGAFGYGNASPDIRGVFPTQVKIKNAWTTPVLRWTGPNGNLTPGIKPNQLKWIQPDGSEGDAERDTVFLVVQVGFRSQASKDIGTINLNDWFLDSVFMTQDSTPGHGKRPVPLEIRNPKLLAPAETNNGSAVPTPIAVPVKGNDLPYLDASSVRLDKLFVNGQPGPAWLPAAGLKPAGKNDKPNALIIASDAAWNFDPEARNQIDAEATLVFLVPSLSQPFQYGLRYGQKPTALAPGTHLETGLIPGVIQKLPGFTVKINDVDRKSSLPELGRAKPDHEFMIAKISISRSDVGPAVMNQKDLLLSFESPKDKKENADFPGLLREEYVTKNGKTEPERKFNNTELHAGQPLTPPPVKSEKPAPASAVSAISASSATGAIKPDGIEVEVCSDWEFYFKAQRATVDVTLIFEVPRGKPSAQFKFKLPEELPTAAPDWYLQLPKNRKKVSANTNTVSLTNSEVVPTLPLISSGGKVIPFSVGEESGAEMVVLTITLAPKKADDLGYYEIKVSDLKAQLKLKNQPKDVSLFALRGPNEQAFRRRDDIKNDEILTIHGSTNLSLAIYAVKGYAEIQLRVAAFPPLEVPNPAAPPEPAVAPTPGPRPPVPLPGQPRPLRPFKAMGG